MERIERACCWVVVLWLVLAVIVSYAGGQVQPGQSIQAAIDANPTGTVTIAAGTYAETLYITTGVTIQGAGALETILTPTPGANAAVITLEDVPGGAVIRDIQVTGGMHTAGFPYGGGIYVHRSPVVAGSGVGVTVQRCVIRGNSATYGGGVGVASSNVLLDHCTVAGNSSGNSAVRYSSSSGGSEIRDSIIWGNSTPIAVTSSSAIVVANSCLQGSGVSGGSWTGSWISADPLLDPSTYHLASGSPAAGMGAYPDPVIAPSKVAVATGLTAPLLVTHDPQDPGWIYIVQQDGLILRQELSGGAPALWKDHSALTARAGERGLLGLAFGPDGYIINYTSVLDGSTHVEFRPRDGHDDEVTTLLHVQQPQGNHNGGWVGFGPDGLLYIAMGDGGGIFNPGNTAQDPASLLGKVLRMKARAGETPEIWLMGLRNPWRCSWDGADLLIGDVGQFEREEMDRVPIWAAAGTNLGWNCLEGTRPTGVCIAAGTWAPEMEYDHSVGVSIIGGYVYRGQAIPELTGQYVFGDYVGRVFRWDGSAITEMASLRGGISGLSSMGIDENGEVYICSASNGAVYRVTP